MQINFCCENDNNPKPEDAGTVKFTVFVFHEDDCLTFSTSSLVKEFIDHETNECQGNEELSDFLWDAGLSTDDIVYGITRIDDYVLTCSEDSGYSPGCALDICVELTPEENLDEDDDDDDAEMQEALEVSFNETNPWSRSASKQAVESLPRKIYNQAIQRENKKTKISEECPICMEGFRFGEMLVTLPCGHGFDDECIKKWLKISYICPLCRYQLPCEDN